MKLTKEQQLVVEQNMGLVGKVIKDRVHGTGWSYEDLFQIGCIGLCKAAATDRGGACFSTYAYRLIWNEICDTLISDTRRAAREQLSEEPALLGTPVMSKSSTELKLDLQSALRDARQGASPSVQKGIESLLLMDAGYTCREIGERMNAPANVVTAWVSKSRKYLQSREDVRGLRSGRAA